MKPERIEEIARRPERGIAGGVYITRDERDELIAALREALAENERSGWLEIHTAPRDGTVVELWHHVHRCVVTAKWSPDDCPHGTQWLTRTLDHTWPTSSFSHWRLPSSAPKKTPDEA